ncbi:MAG: hypothetical protein Q7T82_21175 [Armatimonadota bacterium]|nr:hypothetical protein [Armatimonadota bacterium]
MSRYTVSAVLALVALLAFGAAASAAPSVFGTSGNIITPDDTILASGAFNIAYHGISTDGDNANFFAANVGLLPNLEVGATVATDGDTDVLINAKYRVLAEAASRPAVTIGVIDAGQQLTDDSGFYILLSKSLTPVVESATEKTVGPVRGHLGFGSGVVQTIFAALDWTVTPKLSLMLEVISDSELPQDSMFNIGGRYAISDDLRLDLGLIDFDDLTYGISYQALKF